MADEKTDKDTTPPDDKGTEGGDDKGTGTEEWKPPTKEEWDRVINAKDKAKAEAHTRREELARERAKTEGDAEKAAREQAEAAERKFKPIAVRSAAKAAFLEAGLQPGKSIAPLVRMLDLDTITIDDDGDVVGLDDQIASIKKDYPELFTPTEKRPPRVDGADKQSTGGRPQDAADKIAALLSAGR